MAESFNSYILEARSNPIICMLEDIRVAVMCMFAEKHQVFMKQDDNVCPRIRKKIELLKYGYREWSTEHNGDNKFKVKKGWNGYLVDLVDRVCSCRLW